MRLKSIEVLRGYAMDKTQLSKIADNIEREVDETLESERSENARLRELMNIMAYCIQGWRKCDGCRVNGGPGIITERAGCYVLLDRLCELGVEVSDD